MQALLDAIFKVQGKYELNDRQFSLKLGFDPAAWYRIKIGEIKPSADFLGRLSNHFPELDFQITSYLKSIGADNDRD